MRKGPWFDKNMLLLRNNHPDLFLNFEAGISEDVIEVFCFNAASGDITAKAKNRNTGREVLLHCNHDPWAEAKQIADEMKLKGGELRCLIGMGLGYLPIEIVRRKLTHYKLLIVEPSPHIFAAAMEWMDLKEILETEDVIINLGKRFFFKEILAANEISVYMYGLPISNFEPERELMPDYYSHALHHIREAGQAELMTITTKRNLNSILFKNLMYNFTEMMNSANVAVLKDTMAGRPAVLIGAGPSLTDGIDALKEFGDRAFLIAVDSALPVLQKHGITPHIAVTVDYADECFEKIKNMVSALDNIPLCYLSTVNPLTAKLYPCPVKFFISPFILFLEKMQNEWETWTKLPFLEGVAHFAFFIAVYTKASPIIFLGFDLAYSGFSSHADGMAVPVSINLDQALWVKGMNGEFLPTMQQMMSMRSRLEELISFYEVTCYNACKKGAKIEGALPCNLEELLSSAQKQSLRSEVIVSKCFENAKLPDASRVISLLHDYRASVNKVSNSIGAVIKKSDRALKALEKDQFDDGLPLMVTAKTLQEVLSEQKKVMKRISESEIGDFQWIISGLVMDIKAKERDLHIKAQNKSKWQQINIEIKLIYESMKGRSDVLKEVIGWLNKLIKRLETEIKLKNNIKRIHDTQGKGNILKQLGQNYVEYCDSRQAEKVLRESLGQNKDDIDTMLLLAKALGQQHRHNEAEMYLKQALALSDRPEVIQVLKEEREWVVKKLSDIRRHMNLVGSFVRLPLAIKYCKEILECYPEHNEAKAFLDEADAKLNYYQNETSLLISFMQQDEYDALERINSLIEKGDTVFVERILKILIKKYPLNGLFIERLGIIMMEKGERDLAKNMLIQSLSLSPDRPDARVYLGMMYAEENDIELACNYLIQALNLSPQKFAAINETLGDLNFEIGRYSDAKNCYDKFFQTYPERRDILRKLECCYGKLKS